MNYETKLFEDLNNEKIEYVVWKNSNLIEKFFKGEENLDIFINKKHHNKFNFLIKKNNWIEVKSTTNNFIEIKHYLYFLHNKVLHIHAYYSLITGNSISKNYDLSNFKNYFQNKHLDGKYNIWILNYDIQLLLFKIRLLIKRKSWLGKFLVYRDIDNYKDELSNILIRNRYTDKDLYFKKKDIYDYGIIFDKFKRDTKLIYSIKNFKRLNFLQSFFYEFNFLIKIFIKKLFKLKKFKLNKKIIIFISGADSSGKTTITKDLECLLKKYLKTRAFTIAKPYPKFIINIFIRNKYFKKNKQPLKQGIKRGHTGYLKIIKNINLSMLRYIYSIYIFYFNKTYNVIILDRYLSENIGDINGPRINNSSGISLLKRFFSKVEIFFYKSSKIVDHEYRIIADLEICLSRNKERLKEVKKDDNEIINRFNKFKMSNFKSKKIFEINNNSSKENSLTNILKTLSKNINENN